MKIIDPIDNPTEAVMSDNIGSRYGFAPTAAFAATRACAERRAYQLATTTTKAVDAPGSHASLLRRFTTRVRQAI
jgi:hypothetical protein